MARVGVCTGDDAANSEVADLVRTAGHHCIATVDGAGCLDVIGPDDAIEAIVLDVRLPDADGRDVFQALRVAGQFAPVLFLSTRGAVTERLAGLTAGADNYLVKPFAPRELLRRVEDLISRGDRLEPHEPDDLVLDPAKHAITCGDREALLTPTEFRMLTLIASRSGETVHRHTIKAATWPGGKKVNDNMIHHHTHSLRAKLSSVGSPVHLHTVHGIGVRLQ